MSDNSIYFLVINCPTEEVALSLGEQCLKLGLVRSFNVSSPMSTAYQWRGELVQNTEVQLILKPNGKKLPDVVAVLEAGHPFEVPSIVGWPITAVPDTYRKYILEIDD